MHDDEPIRHQGQTPVYMSQLPSAGRVYSHFPPETEDCVSLAELKHKSITKQTCLKQRTDHITEDRRGEQSRADHQAEQSCLAGEVPGTRATWPQVCLTAVLSHNGDVRH